ncbi:MAG: hypothetical protein KAT01_04055 [Candidatus Aminicenantes bacterium]|nr:hypothetical protein [Candidatus Aminicenantes bacterium]
MVDKSVLDGPLHATSVDNLALVHLLDSGGIEIFEVLQGIAIDEDEVRKKIFGRILEVLFILSS